jgi:hypothetical protein
MRVLSKAFDSASVTSAVSKWRPFDFIFNQGNRKVAGDQFGGVVFVGGDSRLIFGKKFSDKKKVRDGALF